VDTAGFELDHLDDPKIVICTVHDSYRETIDALIAAVRHDLVNWPDETPYRVLYDLSDSQFRMTPYFMHRVEELLVLTERVSGGYAILVEENPADTMTSYLIKRTIAPRTSTLAFKAFTDRQAALDWLTEQE